MLRNGFGSVPRTVRHVRPVKNPIFDFRDSSLQGTVSVGSRDPAAGPLGPIDSHLGSGLVQRESPMVVCFTGGCSDGRDKENEGGVGAERNSRASLHVVEDLSTNRIHENRRALYK